MEVRDKNNGILGGNIMHEEEANKYSNLEDSAVKHCKCIETDAASDLSGNHSDLPVMDHAAAFKYEADQEPSTSDDREGDISEEKKSIKEESKVLSDECLSYYRFYCNDPHRNYDQFGYDSQLTPQMLRLILTSARVLFEVYGFSSEINVTESSFYSESQHYVKFHTPDPCIIAWLVRISSFNHDYMSFLVSRKAGQRCIDRPLMKLIRLVKRFNMGLEIDDSLRTRLIDQYTNDVGLKIRESDYCGRENIHYGVAPSHLIHSANNISEVKKDSLEHLRMLDYIRSIDNDLELPPELDQDTFRYQKFKIREMYMVDAFRYPCEQLDIENSNFLTVVQYIPLPSMPFLKGFTGNCLLQDLFIKNTFDAYSMILKDMVRAAPKCKVKLRLKPCIYSTSYELVSTLLRETAGALQRLLNVMRMEENSDLDAQIHLYMPVSEEQHQIDFFIDMSAVNQLGTFEFTANKWSYTALLELPSREGDRSVLFAVYCYLNDAILQILDGKDIIVV